MVAIAGGSQKKLSTEEAYELIAGTWVNEEYSKVFDQNARITYGTDRVKCINVHLVITP